MRAYGQKTVHVLKLKALIEVSKPSHCQCITDHTTVLMADQTPEDRVHLIANVVTDERRMSTLQI